VTRSPARIPLARRPAPDVLQHVVQRHEAEPRRCEACGRPFCERCEGRPGRIALCASCDALHGREVGP
jgi:CRISPR/Cas system-associated protein Cas10 (large subunit of type III CRISPR-Cas system)